MKFRDFVSLLEWNTSPLTLSLLWRRYFNMSTTQRTRENLFISIHRRIESNFFQWTRCTIHLKRNWNQIISRSTNNRFSNLPRFQDAAIVRNSINVYSSCLTFTNIFYNTILRKSMYSRITNQSIIISRNRIRLSNPENSLFYVKRFIGWSLSRFRIELSRKRTGTSSLSVLPLTNNFPPRHRTSSLN